MKLINEIEYVQIQFVFDEFACVESDDGVQVLFSFDVKDAVSICIVDAPAVKTSAAEQKKSNKIINNSYKRGDNLKGDEYRFDQELKVDSGYASSHLSNIYDVENNMALKNVQDEIMRLYEKNSELHDLLDDDKPKKFNNEKINRIFKIIYEHFTTNPEIMKLSNLIYIFDTIANMSGLKYPSMFNMLNTEYQQLILIELDKQFDIFKSNGKAKRMF